MLQGRIIMLGAAGVGSILGTLFALTVPTAMKAGPESNWRERIPQHQVPRETFHYVDSGPIDAGPTRWVDPPITADELPAYIVPAYSEELQTVMEDADAVDTQQDQPDQAAETETIARQAETPHHVPPPEAWETESTLERPEVESVPAIVNSPRDVPPTTS